jgi:hypothetical protein
MCKSSTDTSTLNCQCDQPAAGSAGYGEDLERRTREGRLTFPEAIAKLQGRHCRYVERHGVRLQLSNDLTVVDERFYFPALDANAYLADNWHIVKP